MSLRFASSCLSSLLLAVAALAGCTEHEARFADATPAQLERVYSTSSGLDLRAAWFLATAFSGRNDTMSCPAVVTKDQDTTVSGGCTDEDGVRLEGSIEIHNVPGLLGNPAYDSSQPSSIEYDFQFTPPEQDTVAIDGRVESDKSNLSGDLTIDTEGIASTSRLTLVCTIDGTCTASPDSEIEISNLGGASVEGTWGVPELPRGLVTVRGADVLVFDIGSTDENGCVSYTIGDKRGTVCTPGTGEGAQPALAGLRARRWLGL